MSSPEVSLPDWAAASASPRLGRFALGPEVGSGGLGRVHLAWDPTLRRKVALKRLYGRNPELGRRFLLEAQHQGRLAHPHICPIHEVGTEPEPFIVMRLVEGPPLSELRLKLDPRAAAQVMADVAGAIHAAHRSGLVHRDLKPQNILVERRPDGTLHPFVVDFGLARDFTQADLTLSWALSGTPAFMSPAQAMGEPSTPSDDIFALGATLYAVLSGSPPYEAASMAGLVAKHAVGEPRPLRALRPDIPRDLETIALACLSPEPPRRYASAFDLEADLRRFLAGEPILARPLGLVGRAWRRALRHRALSAAIASALLLALGLGGWNLHASRRARMQLELAQRLGLQVREVEQMMRIERMLRPHDLRPAEALVRQRMDEIRGLMASLGYPAQGPGHYALGRGHLVLREYAEARMHLDAAWQQGFRTPEAAQALGTVLMELYIPEATRHNRDISLTDRTHQEFAVPALKYFEQARGAASLESPEAGEAVVAFLRKDAAGCIAKCREAFRKRPWHYEMKILESLAWRRVATQSQGTLPLPRLTTEEGRRALEEGRLALAAAAEVAPSDERITQEELDRITLASIFDSELGIPDPKTFEPAEPIFERALALRPENPQLIHAWLYTRIRRAFAMLRRGQDPRPFVGETLKRATPMAEKDHEAGLAIPTGILHGIAADAAYRWGGDPRPHHEALDRWIPEGHFELIQHHLVRAEAAAARGRNPRPLFEANERLLQAHEGPKAAYGFFFLLWGMNDLAWAQWEWDSGQDPAPRLARALVHLARSRELHPQAVYPSVVLSQVHALMARIALARGGDPGPTLAEGFVAVKEGLALGRGHHLLHLGHAQLQGARALHLRRTGRDPRAALEDARSALREGLAMNPTDFRLHRELARTELLAYGLETGALRKAEVAARRGLAVKKDDPWLWLILARSARLAPGRDPAEPKAHLARALALNPGLLEAQRERAALAP